MDNSKYKYTYKPKTPELELDPVDHQPTEHQSVPVEYQPVESGPAELDESIVGYQETGHQEADYREADYQEADYQEAGYRETGYQENGNQEAEYQEAEYQEFQGYQGTNYQEAGHQEAGYQEVEHAAALQKSGSFFAMMDRFVLSAAIAMLGLFLLGHCVLWLVGGGSSSSTSGTQVASLVEADSEMAKSDASPSEETQTVVADKETVEAEKKTVVIGHDSGDADVSDNSQDLLSDKKDLSETEQDSESNQFRAPATRQNEISFRPSYEENPPTLEAEDVGRSPLGSDWESSESFGSSEMVEMPVTADDGGAVEPELADLDDGLSEERLELDSGSGQMSELSAPSLPELIEAERELVEAEKTPEIAKDSLLLTENDSTTEEDSSLDLLSSPVKFPFRVWTSSRGNNATLALIRVEGGNIVVVDEEGREFTLQAARFSEQDLEYVRDAIRN